MPYHQITLITGPMFSSKSQLLLQKLSSYEAVVNEKDNNKILLINHKNGVNRDVHKHGATTTHRIGFSECSNRDELLLSSISDLDKDLINRYKVIGIDEAQFFTDIELIIDWIKEGKIIIVSGLLSTSEGLIFNNLHKLLPFSEHIQLYAICKLCLDKYNIINKATMTKCLVDKKGNVLIGGSTEYISVCLDHWYD